MFVLMALERDPLLLLSTFIHACPVSPNEWDLTDLCRFLCTNGLRKCVAISMAVCRLTFRKTLAGTGGPFLSSCAPGKRAEKTACPYISGLTI